MRFVRLASVSIAAATFAVATSSVSASDQSSTGASAAPAASVSRPATQPSAVPTAVTAGQFATLTRVKAVPMSSGELEAVKGQHIHFVTPGQNNQFGEVGLHLVNRNNMDNWLDFGTGLAGPGYHGLCGAALRSPSLFIPGQDPITGVGEGC